jgi:hypothetical protein
MDAGQWSANGTNSAGIWPMSVSSGNYLAPQGLPVVKQLSPTDLNIVQPLNGGGAFSVTCTESNLTCMGTNALGQSLNWKWLMVGGSQQTAAVQNVSSNNISYSYQGTPYQLKLSAGTCQQTGNGNLSLVPDGIGGMVLDLGPSNP